jgi:hypothetical protein
MRCSYIAAGLLFLLAPLAAAESSGTTTSTSTTTITRTVVRATQTSTITGSSPSATSDSTISVGGGVVGAQGTGIMKPSTTGGPAETTLPAYSYLGAGSIERGSLNVAVMAGSVALVLGFAL